MKKILLVAFLCLIALFGPLQAQEHGTPIDGAEVVERAIQDEELITLPRLNQSLFYQRIESKTQKILEEMGGQFTPTERSRLQKATAAVLKFLKEQNPFHHVKELLMKHGLGVGITAGLTEFTTIIVLPAIFTSAGMPELAVLSASSPSFLATVPAFLGIKSALLKRKIAKKLGIKDIRALDKLRTDILGYTQKSRILSVIVAKSREEMEVHVIKRPFLRFWSSPMGNIVYLDELKKIVSKYDTGEVVELIKEASHGDDALFGHLLLKQIQRKADAFSELQTLLDERIKDLPLNQHQHSQLILTHEKKEVVKSRLEKVRDLKGKLSKLAETSEEKAAIKNWAEIMKTDLTNLDFDIQRFEYNLLSQIHSGQDISNLDLTSPQTKIVERVKELRDTLKKVEEALNATEVNKALLLKRIKEYNRLWIPLEVRLTSRGDCYGWMRFIISRMNQ